jgi:hypothetical protein
MANEWEQSAPSEGEGVDEEVQRYVSMHAGDRGPRSEASSGQGEASGESSDEAVAQIVERVVAQVKDDLDAMRQDLQTYAERTAQSFSDKTASRLTQQQRERNQQIDRILGFLKDDLGADFEEVARRVKVQAFLDGAGREEDDEGESAQPMQQPQAAQPPATGQPASEFVQQYMSVKLGDPANWSRQDQQAIWSEVVQARTLQEQMAVVDKYAANGPGQTAGGSPTQQPRGNPGRAMPVGTQAGRPVTPSLEDLSAALDAAVAEGNMSLAEKISTEIDKALSKQP